jgi:hypothetical protein
LWRSKEALLFSFAEVAHMYRKLGQTENFLREKKIKC